MDAAPDLLIGDQGEEALDLVDPGGACWREVDMPSGPLGQPIADGLGFVGGIIVHDQMDIHVGRDVGFDLIQEFAELAGSVLGVAAADHGTGGDVEGREQRCRAMPGIIMGPALHLAGTHGQRASP